MIVVCTLIFLSFHCVCACGIEFHYNLRLPIKFPPRRYNSRPCITICNLALEFATLRQNSCFNFCGITIHALTLELVTMYYNSQSHVRIRDLTLEFVPSCYNLHIQVAIHTKSQFAPSRQNSQPHILIHVFRFYPCLHYLISCIAIPFGILRDILLRIFSRFVKIFFLIKPDEKRTLGVHTPLKP